MMLNWASILGAWQKATQSWKQTVGLKKTWSLLDFFCGVVVR